MALIIKSKTDVQVENKQPSAPRELTSMSELRGSTAQPKNGVQLSINGKEKKFNKASAYLLDMMSDDVE